MIKTIEIDEEAFTRLQQAKESGEDWSQVIRRCVRPKRTLAEIMSFFEKADLSQETLDAVEESVSRRRENAYEPKV
ncbi:MAG TPA: antitoxin VapB family protein [Candidatus Anammoximicrobium sp.]|nr:antitoxin VapB family protein [Candidatus Anammoximicrobium sp.]